MEGTQRHYKINKYKTPTNVTCGLKKKNKQKRFYYKTYKDDDSF